MKHFTYIYIESIPSILMTLFLDDSPFTILIELFVIPNSFESSSTNCLFAAPPTGGDVSLTRNSFPLTSWISVLDDRGATFTSIVMPPFAFLNGISIAMSYDVADGL